MEENFALFDFELSTSDMAALTGLDRGERTGPDPDTVQLHPAAGFAVRERTSAAERGRTPHTSALGVCGAAHTEYAYSVSMSIRHGLLALLERGPTLRLPAARRVRGRPPGATWPLNIGQVYTTLARLERDGLVGRDGCRTTTGGIVYEITEAGRAELARWFTTPVAPGRPAPRRAGHQARAGGDHARRRRAAPSSRPSAPRRCARCRSSPGSRARRRGGDLAWRLVLDS